MKKLALLLALTVPQAFGAFTFIGNNKASAASNSAATTPPTTTSGNFLVAIVVTYSTAACNAGGGAGTYAVVTDSKSNTWQFVQNYVNGNSNICIWYAENATTGAGHTFTVTPSSSGGYPTIFASWWSGAATSSTKDQQSGAGSATGTTLQPGSITPTADNELVITGISDNDVVDKTISGYTRQDTQLSNSFETGAWAYSIQTTATATNPTWTEAASGIPRSVAIVSFKAPAGGGGSAPRKRVVVIP